MNGEMLYRVVNKCKFNIGVQKMNGLTVSIRPSSFQMLSANDIMYIESICVKRKLFGTRMLVAYDDNNNEVPFEMIGVVEETDNSIKHFSDEDIKAALSMGAKKVEAWLEDITDPAQLHAIYMVAKSMELTTTKLNLLVAKMPEKDWLDA